MRATSGTAKRKIGPPEQATGWQIRCSQCHFTELWDKKGIRLKAAGPTYTFGCCPYCKRIRMRVIEKAAN